MFFLLKKCIYCLEPLNDAPRGEGEHVIPKSIYGFWRIYDICPSCKQYFGDGIDQLAIKDVHILHAMDELELPNVEKYLDGMPYVSHDALNNRQMPMVRKKGRYKNKVVTDGNRYLECAEQDWEIVGIEWLKKFSNLNEQEFAKEATKLKTEYLKLKPGEEVHSDLLGCTIRKGQTSKVKYDESKLPDIAQLIAKISLPFIVYALNRDQILDLNEVDSLAHFARYGQISPGLSFKKLPVDENRPPHPFHRLWMSSVGNMVFVDVTFFGRVHWRITITKSIPLVFETNDQENADEIMLVFDFEKPDEKGKHIVVKRLADKKYVSYSLEA